MLLGMARTDRRGRDLKQFLQAEILGRDITFDELRESCNVSAARYYRRGNTAGRADAEDFPNADELRHVSEYYKLGDTGWLNLLVEFDWMDTRPEAGGYTDAVSTVTVLAPETRRVKTRREMQKDTATGRPPL